MYNLSRGPLALLLACGPTVACGPLAPPLDAASSTSTTSGETTATSNPTDGGADGPRPCNVWTQDCPPGQKCTPYADDGGATWNATKCVDITGDDAPTEPCTAVGGGATGVDSCALGAMCWSVDESGHGVCVGLCTGTPDAPICPPIHYCAQSGPLNFCFQGCDPLIMDCGEGELCIPDNNSFLCAQDASGAEGQLNDPCGSANACDPGLVCIPTADASSACQAATGCCQPFCEFPDSPCPNPDQACVRWFPPMQPIPEGYEKVGVCAIPE